MDDGKDSKCSHRGEDLVRLGPVLQGSYRPYIRHCSDCNVEAGLVRPLVEGESLTGDALFLEHQKGDMYRVSDEFRSKPKGPAKVVTDDYRVGWDRIFGGTPVVGEA